MLSFNRKGTRLTGRLLVGKAFQPNKKTGEYVFINIDAQLVAGRECEGNGWYSIVPDKPVWTIKYWAEHRGPKGYSHPHSAWDRGTLAQLVEKAILDIHRRYCKKEVTNVQCA